MDTFRTCIPHVVTDDTTKIFSELGIDCSKRASAQGGKWWAPDQPSYSSDPKVRHLKAKKVANKRLDVVYFLNPMLGPNLTVLLTMQRLHIAIQDDECSLVQSFPNALPVVR